MAVLEEQHALAYAKMRSSMEALQDEAKLTKVQMSSNVQEEKLDLQKKVMQLEIAREREAMEFKNRVQQLEMSIENVRHKAENSVKAEAMRREIEFKERDSRQALDHVRQPPLPIEPVRQPAYEPVHQPAYQHAPASTSSAAVARPAASFSSEWWSTVNSMALWKDAPLSR